MGVGFASPGLSSQRADRVGAVTVEAEDVHVEDASGTDAQLFPGPVDGSERAEVAVTGLSLAVGREFGTVLVTVAGLLDAGGCRILEGLVADLIDGQGNRTVTVDLSGADVAPDTLRAFRSAMHGAGRHGDRCILRSPTLSPA